MRKIYFDTPASAETQHVRVGKDCYDFLTLASKKTRLSISEVATRIMRQAIPYVVFVENPVYDMAFKDDEKND